MQIKNKKISVVLLNLLTAALVFFLSFLDVLKIPGNEKNIKLFGIIIVYIGILVLILSSIYLKKAIMGIINPRLDIIVKNGPYKFCRHPAYFGITISMLGLAISLRSWIGIITVLFLFLPTEIHRAKLEEKAMAQKFGEEWFEYVKNTSFFFPFL